MILHSSRRARPGLRSLVALLIAGSLGLGCRSAAGDPSSHWNVDSLPNRASKHFLGWKGPVDGSYVSYQAQKKRDVNLTLRRHFLHNNPDNPFQVQDSSRYEIPPPHGLRPDPIGWFGVESVFIGAVALASSGAFVPIPLDSLLALCTSEGRKEFGDSLTADFVGNRESGWSPPPVETFRVKSR